LAQRPGLQPRKELVVVVSEEIGSVHLQLTNLLNGVVLDLYRLVRRQPLDVVYLPTDSRIVQVVGLAVLAPPPAAAPANHSIAIGQQLVVQSSPQLDRPALTPAVVVGSVPDSVPVLPVAIGNSVENASVSGSGKDLVRLIYPTIGGRIVRLVRLRRRPTSVVDRGGTVRSQGRVGSSRGRSVYRLTQRRW
jgi:hypothetical protein